MSKSIILGAGGHSKEVLDILVRDNTKKEISFFNNTSSINYKLFDEFNVYCKNKDLQEFDTFYLGVGNIEVRKKLSNLAINLGVTWKGIRSNLATIASFDVNVDATTDIMDGVYISSSTNIGKGVLLNRNVNIHHDVIIGDFCEIGPNVQILGSVQVGGNTFIGAGSIIREKVKICSDVVLGMGSVVLADITKPGTYVGVPAKKIK